MTNQQPGGSAESLGQVVPAGQAVEVTLESGEAVRGQQLALAILEKISSGQLTIPEAMQGELAPHLGTAKKWLASLGPKTGGILEGLSEGAQQIGQAVAENAAPMAKKGVDAASVAHVASIVARYGVMKGGARAIGAGVDNALTVWLAKIAINRIEKMIGRTAENLKEAMA